MAYATNATEQVTRLLGVIDADPKISKETKKLTIEYVKFLEANRKNPRTISKRLFSLRTFYSTIGKASLSKLGKKGMVEAMAALEKKPLAATTKADVKIPLDYMTEAIVGIVLGQPLKQIIKLYALIVIKNHAPKLILCRIEDRPVLL